MHKFFDASPKRAHTRKDHDGECRSFLVHSIHENMNENAKLNFYPKSISHTHGTIMNLFSPHTFFHNDK